MSTQPSEKIYLPRDLQKVFNAISGLSKINLGLVLNKYAKFHKKGNDYEVKIKDVMSDFFQKNRIPRNKLDVEGYNIYRERYSKLLNDIHDQGFSVNKTTLRLVWRLIINLGAESIYETSIVLHRNYSVPIIPGSAVKGVTNHYARGIKHIPESVRDEIFGTQKNKGKVIFLDALPIIDTKDDFIVLDVMNVHYRDYYQDESGKTPPGDWMSPELVFFLAVEKLKYQFAVASEEKELSKKALDLLKEALGEIGIGAKTSAGYGYFEPENKE